MAKVKRVGHVLLHTRNAREAAKFYEEALGMNVIYGNPHLVFLSFGLEHHDIGLWQVSEDADYHPASAIHHIALEIDGGEEELRLLYGRLLKAGAQIDSIRDHGVSRGVYFFDRDGNRLEIFYNVLQESDGPSWLEGYHQKTAQEFLLDEKGGPYKEIELEPIMEENVV